MRVGHLVRSLRIVAVVVAFVLPLGAYVWLHAPAVHDGKTHVRYMAWGNPEQQLTEQQMLARFEELNPDIKVDYLMVPGGAYAQKLQVMLFSETEPDVFRVDRFMLPQFFKHGYFEPLDDYMARDAAAGTFDRADFFPQALDEVSYGGKTYGVNVLFGGRLLYYNKDLFSARGLPDPYEQYQRGEWTYDAMVRAATALTTRDKQGNTLDYGIRLDFQDLFWICWGFGGNVLHDDGTCALTDPASLDGLRFFASLLRGVAGPGRGVMPLPGEGVQGSWTFESGSLGLYSSWAGEAPRLRRLCNFNWDVVPIPAGPKGRFCIVKGNGLMVSARSRHKDAAWQLTKFLVSPEVETRYGGDSLRRSIPTRKSVASSETFARSSRAPFNSGTFAELYKTARPLPVTGRWTYTDEIMRNWMDRLGRGVVTPEQCAAGARRELADKFERLDAIDRQRAGVN